MLPLGTSLGPVSWGEGRHPEVATEKGSQCRVRSHVPGKMAGVPKSLGCPPSASHGSLGSAWVTSPQGSWTGAPLMPSRSPLGKAPSGTPVLLGHPWNQKGLRWARIPHLRLIPSLVPEERGRQFCPPGCFQCRAAHGEHWSHTGELRPRAGHMSQLVFGPAQIPGSLPSHIWKLHSSRSPQRQCKK